MALLGNAKPTSERLAEFRKNADKGRIWIYQNLDSDTPVGGNSSSYRSHTPHRLKSQTRSTGRRGGIVSSATSSI